MAKVFGIHTIELNPGVSAEEFIRFINDEFARLIDSRLGWKLFIAKADRGERDGKLALIWEIPSVEQRNRYIPTKGQLSEEAIRMLEPDLSRLFETWNKLAVGSATDYVVQA